MTESSGRTNRNCVEFTRASLMRVAVKSIALSLNTNKDTESIQPIDRTTCVRRQQAAGTFFALAAMNLHFASHEVTVLF